MMHEQDPTEELGDAVATLAGTSSWRWGIAAARSEDPARLPVHDRVWLAAAREGGALLDRFGIALAILPTTMTMSGTMPALGTRGRWSIVLLPVAPPAAVLRGWMWAIDPGDVLGLLFAPGGGTNVPRGTVVLAGAGRSQPDRGPPLPCRIQTLDRRRHRRGVHARHRRLRGRVVDAGGRTGRSPSTATTPTGSPPICCAAPCTSTRACTTCTGPTSRPGSARGAIAAACGLLAVVGLWFASRRRVS